MINQQYLLKNLLFSIENGLRNDINSDILAKGHNLSTGHLERIFKYAFNTNLGSYIRSRKLAVSLNDLLRSNDNVLDIALNYCFEFEQSYIRSFKREFGITPGKFRRTGRVVNITPPLNLSHAKKLPENILAEQESDFVPKVFAVGRLSGTNISLPGSPYGYELYAEKGNDNQLMWYGAEERGGAAFKAKWNNAKWFSSRIGYFWDEGKPYSNYNNIYCDYSIENQKNSSDSELSYIGIYGWTKNPLIEWYIIDNWFGNQSVRIFRTGYGKIGEYYTDGSVYYLYKNARYNQPSIEGINNFKQYFSVRKTPRQKGTICVSKHFKQWEKAGMPLGNNLYEAKFIVETGGGTGSFDAKYVSFYTVAVE